MINWFVFFLWCEGLHREEKLIELGSRNFFLCLKKTAPATEGGVTTPFVSCAKEANKARRSGGGGFGWFKLMQFMLWLVG